MAKYKVEITEYLQRTIEVEADNESDAVFKVEENYHDAKEVLDYSDHTGTDIEIYNPNKFIPKLELLMDRIGKFNKDRDWDQFHTPTNLAKSISIEANELLECYQWNDNANLEDVKLHNVEFENCNLFSSNFFNTKLQGIDFTSSNIEGIIVDIPNIKGAIVSELQAIDLAKLLGIIIK